MYVPLLNSHLLRVFRGKYITNSRNVYNKLLQLIPYVGIHVVLN